MTGMEWLRSLHTKRLLKLKNKYRQALLYQSCVCADDVNFTYQELKQVLSKRPQFLTKQKLSILERQQQSIKYAFINLAIS